MTMTREENQEFWKLGARLQHLDEDDPVRQIVEASYEPLRCKMVAEIDSLTEDGGTAADEAAAPEIDMKTAADLFKTLLCTFASVVQVIPQLQVDPAIAKLVKSCHDAVKWMDERKDSLKNPEV